MIMSEKITHRKANYLLLLFFLWSANGAHAVNVTMEEYFLEVGAGNGVTNNHGPFLTGSVLPFNSTQQFSQLPSSVIAHYSLGSFDSEPTVFEITNTLTAGRVGPNATPRASSNNSIEIRPHEPVLVDLEARMSYDLPSAFMTATSSMFISNFELNKSIGGGNMFPGVSFEGDPIADSSSIAFDNLLLEPGYLYRITYSLRVTAFTDLIGPVGTAEGFGRITFRSVPEPGMGAMVLLGGAMMLRRRRR